MTITIRTAETSDLHDIVRIFMEEYKKYPYNENWSQERALEKVKNYFIPERDIYVALAVKDFAGFVVLETFTWDTEDRGMIDELVVLSKFQGQGIGKKLIETAEEYFRKKGIGTVILSANKNAGAFEFYRALDYKNTDYVELIKKIK